MITLNFIIDKLPVQNKVLQSITLQCYKALQSITVLQAVTKCFLSLSSLLLVFLNKIFLLSCQQKLLKLKTKLKY